MAAKAQGTWQVYQPAGIAALTNVDTTAAYDLGYRCKARDSGTTAYGPAEFIYLKGGTNVAAGSVVTINGDNSVTLITARAKGAVALAISAVDATTKFGWFQILGRGVAKCDTVAASAACYIDGTDGRIDDAAVAGDCILGMATYTADDTSTCVVNMSTYPSTGDFDNA